jgi:hypothetical protein
MTDASAPEDGALDSLVARVADEFAARQKQGEQPDVEEYAARHPEIAPVLRRVLASLQLLGLTPSAGPATGVTTSEEPASGVLGDFRIIREIGRGGMGVVYEAEQISLGRRVALKVLPMAATMDPRQLQRFHNEARAAACLHYPGIVPVYFVGCERGVHFYAMQFIDGQPLRTDRRPAGAGAGRGGRRGADDALRAGDGGRLHGARGAALDGGRGAGPGVLPAGGRADGAGGRGAGARPPDGRGASGRQAGQPAGGRARPAVGGRLRPGAVPPG